MKVFPLNLISSKNIYLDQHTGIAVGSSPKSEQVMHQIQESWISHICHFVFFLAAFVCFLPQMMGYQVVLDVYPDGLENLTNDKPLYTSLVVSIALTSVTLIESVLDSLIEMSKKYFTKDKIKKENSMTYFKFPKIILVFILAKDLLIMLYSLPYQRYNILSGIYLASDVLFTWCYFYNLTRLGNPIWTLPKVFTISLIFSSVIVAFSWIVMSEAAAFNTDLYVAIQFFTALGLFLFSVVVGQWIHYVWSKCQESTDALTYLKLIQTSIFVLFFIFYLLADWAVIFVPNLPPEWNVLGSNFLTLMISVMAGCTVCVSITSSSISKLCSILLSNVSFFSCFFLIITI